MDIPKESKKEDSQVAGKLKLFSKSEQEILSIELEMVEEWSIGRGEDKITREFVLGELDLVEENFKINSGETKEYDFILKYELVKSKNDKMKDKGGVSGALGKAGSFLDAEKSVFYVIADVDVKGTALDPGDKQRIKLV